MVGLRNGVASAVAGALFVAEQSALTLDSLRLNIECDLDFVIDGSWGDMNACGTYMHSLGIFGHVSLAMAVGGWVTVDSGQWTVDS